MSTVRPLTPDVETILLSTHFAVITDAVSALRLPSKSSTPPPLTVNRLLSLTALLGLREHAIFPFVVCLPLGTSDPGINLIVLVPCMSHIPYASCPNSLEKDFSHIMRYSPLIRWLYSCTIPVIGWMTELARLCMQCISIFWITSVARAYLDVVLL